MICTYFLSLFSFFLDLYALHSGKILFRISAPLSCLTRISIAAFEGADLGTMDALITLNCVLYDHHHLVASVYKNM